MTAAAGALKAAARDEEHDLSFAEFLEKYFPGEERAELKASATAYVEGYHAALAERISVHWLARAYAVGLAAWRLGAGRARKEDQVQAGAGVEMHAKPGDRVTEGEPLLTLHTDAPERFEGALQALDGDAVGIAAPGEAAGDPAGPIVLDRIA